MGFKITILILMMLPGLLAAQVPSSAWQYRSEMIRSAWRIHGPGAPVATLAAQIHQESAWRCDAVSWAGAQGCAQFMPGTGKDAAKRWPSDCSPANPFSPRWAFTCRDRYIKSLKPKSMTKTVLSPCNDWAFRLKGYNGGNGWVARDRKMALEAGANPDSWEDVSLFNAGRRESAYRENKEYPERIFKLEAGYSSWGRQLRCLE